MEVRDEMLGGDVLHEQLWPVLTAAVLPSLRLTRGDRCDPASLSTRLGGWPLLAPGTPWPRTAKDQALCLIGQWNTNEVNGWLGEPSLPADQVLSFFYEAVEQSVWGFDPADADSWRVIATALDEAVPLVPPQDATTFRSFPMTAQRVLTVPDLWDPVLDELVQQDRDAVTAAYHKLGDGDDRSPRHRAFGWPEPMQNAMQLECQLAANGIYVGGPEGYRDPRAQELQAGAGDWILLWQVDSDEEAGWTWGDVGTIYFWIRRQDLAAGAFDRVWLILQSA